MAKILVVDDSKVLRTQISALLRGGGHEIIEAENGDQGIQAVKDNHDIQLIFADYNMPGMNGVEMSAKIKATPQGKNIPIFMLTTESGPDVMAAGKEAGVMAWILKPLNHKNILTVLGKVLK